MSYIYPNDQGYVDYTNYFNPSDEMTVNNNIMPPDHHLNEIMLQPILHCDSSVDLNLIQQMNYAQNYVYPPMWYYNYFQQNNDSWTNNENFVPSSERSIFMFSESSDSTSSKTPVFVPSETPVLESKNLVNLPVIDLPTLNLNYPTIDGFFSNSNAQNTYYFDNQNGNYDQNNNYNQLNMIDFNLNDSVPYDNNVIKNYQNNQKNTEINNMEIAVQQMRGITECELNSEVININYCTVPGRLSLLNNAKKYNVTVGEIYHRTSIPECLNTSFLGGILRKAKNKNGGKELRTAIEQFGIKLPAGRRKSTPTTIFTAFCEEEALVVCRDFLLLIQKTYPVRELASFVQNLYSEEFYNSTFYFVEMIDEFIELLGTVISSLELSEREELRGATPTALAYGVSHEDIKDFMENSLLRFSRLTHRFGNHAIIVTLSTLIQLLVQLKLLIENELKIHTIIGSPMQFQNNSMVLLES